MGILTFVLILALSIILGTALTYTIRNIARSKGWVSFPESHHIHRKGIPRLGGVAVFITFILLYTVGAYSGANPGWKELLPIVSSASLLFLVGLVDDVRGIAARVKLVLQIIAGVVFFGLRVWILHSAPFMLAFLPDQFKLPVALVITVGWMVLITNAFNLIDGLDGLASGASLFSLIALFGLALSMGNKGMIFTTLVLGGAVLGFLRFNFNPASIFLGDGGSLFLGAMLCGLSLVPQRGAAPFVVMIAIPLLVFSLPIMETSLSVLRRFLGAKPLFAPDKDHIHHRLLKLGFTHRQAVLLLYIVCAGCSLSSLLLKYPSLQLEGLILTSIGILLLVGIVCLGYQEFSEIFRIIQRWFDQKRVIANNIAIRKATRKLSECSDMIEVSRALDMVLDTEEFDSYIFTLNEECVLHRIAADDEIIDSASFDEDRYDSQKLPVWSISLELPLRGKRPMGMLKFNRAYTDKDLYLDANLLLNNLRTELGAACARIHARETHRINLELVQGALPKHVDGAMHHKTNTGVSSAHL